MRACLNCELCQLQKLFDSGHIFDDLAGLRADADIAEVRYLVLILVAVVGDIDQCFKQPCNVNFGRLWKIGEVAYAGNVFAPARYCFIYGLKCFVKLAVARDVVEGLAILFFVGCADLELALPVPQSERGRLAC